MFEINNQTLTKTDDFAPATDSVGYLKAQFIFNTDDWTDTVKTAIFKSKNGVFSRALVNGECEIPPEAIARTDDGYILLTVSVVGVRSDGYRIPTTEKTIRFNNSGFVAGAVFENEREDPVVLIGELTKEKEALEARVEELENATVVERQEKTADIVENGTTEITPDEGKVISKVTVNVNVPDPSEELENLIDESGVLDSTDGTATEKVEQLIDLAEWEKVWYEASERIKTAEGLFRGYQGVTMPRTNFISATSMGNFLANTSDSDPNSRSKVEYIDYYINSQNASSFTYMFRYCDRLKWLVGVNTSKATNVSGMFFCCYELETIQQPLDFSKATNTTNPFTNCNKLKNLSFVPETIKVSINIPSPVLSDESIRSIIDGLATVETTQRLTLETGIVAKLTENQVNQIYSKNWEIG